MSKFDECLAKYNEEFSKLNISVDETLLKAVTKACGPSIYNPDASKVSSSDDAELARVKNNFLIKKLELADSPKLDEAIAAVVEQLGASNRNKYRAMFYYLLVKNLGQESKFA